MLCNICKNVKKKIKLLTTLTFVALFEKRYVSQKCWVISQKIDESLCLIHATYD